MESLRGYVYKSHHLEFFKRRAEWFEKAAQPTYALWWIEVGHIPTVTEFSTTFTGDIASITNFLCLVSNDLDNVNPILQNILGEIADCWSHARPQNKERAQRIRRCRGLLLLLALQPEVAEPFRRALCFVGNG